MPIKIGNHIWACGEKCIRIKSRTSTFGLLTATTWRVNRLSNFSELQRDVSRGHGLNWCGDGPPSTKL